MKTNNKNVKTSTTTNNKSVPAIYTLDAYRKAKAEGKLSNVSAIMLVSLLNNKTEMAKTVGVEVSEIITATDTANKAENEKACTAKCAEFIAMDRAEMFRVYSVNPTYTGHKFSGKPNKETGLYELTECDMRIKFVRLEKAYKTIQNDDNATLCRCANYIDRVQNFNVMMYETISGDVGAKKACNFKDSYAKMLSDCGLACFTKNNQENRIACLDAIFSMILPEGVKADALKKDVAFIKQAMSKVKGRTITTVNDRDMMDLIVTAMGCALSFDASKKARSLSYETVSKSGAFEKNNK